MEHDKLEELSRLYRSLYEDESAYEALLLLMKEYSEERPGDLKSLDQARKLNSYWYMDPAMNGITMYTDLFAGSLKKLQNRVHYLKTLGITYLHLMPLMKMPPVENDGGYAIEDFHTVDPRFGTNEDLAELATTLRGAGISLCTDFVINHTASTHVWAEKAKKGDEKYRDFYITYPDRTIPDEFEKTLPEVFPATAPGNFIYCEEMGRWVMSSFYPYQWDMNYRNPWLFNEIAGAMLHMANLGIEVFRFDAVPYIWKELGTNSRNLPEVHTIVRMLRLILESVAPACIIKGEVVMAPKELAAYFGTADAPECHLLYGVATMVNLWSALASQDTELLKRHLDTFLSLPGHCFFVNYLRCHDDIGWGLDEDEERKIGIDPLEHKKFLYTFYEERFPGSFARGQLYNYDFDSQDARTVGTTASLCGLEQALINKDKKAEELALRRILLMHSAIYAFRGFPMLSSGDEIGQLNDYSYLNDLEKASDSRNLHRSRFSWAKAREARKSGTYQSRIWEGIARLRDARKDIRSFAPEAWVRTWQAHNRHVLALRRTAGEDDMFCLFNFSAEKVSAHLDLTMGEYRDYFTGRVYTPGLEVPLEAYEYLYLVKE